MADPFIAEVRLFPFNFAPRGWAWCNGQLLARAQNTSLVQIIGARYGGDATNIALPDIRDRVVIGAGSGPGLTPRTQGQTGGAAEVSLTVEQTAAHTHTIRVNAQDPADINAPGPSSVLAVATGGTPYQAAASMETLAADALATAGGSEPHNNLQPYLTLNFCIALSGVFPG